LGGLLFSLASLFTSPIAGAQVPQTRGITILKVNGLIDPVLADFISTSIEQADARGDIGLILQTDSNGVVISDSQYKELLEQMLAARTLIGVWVGPSGSSLVNGSAQLAGAADQVGVSPGSSIGDSGPALVPGLNAARMNALQNDRLNAQEAADVGVSTVTSPTIGDMVINFPGVETKETTADNGEIRREPITQVEFNQLSLVSNLMHTVASPAVAYLLVTLGLCLIIFELFTAGVGVAGVVGAGSFLLAGYGLWVLPTRWWALVILAISMFAFAVDVQTGVPRFWTGVGVVMFVVFSFTVFDGMSLSWITLLVAIVGVVLAFIGGMPSMVRTRFSTPTIGREWMIGEIGRAVSSVNPDGVVQIRDALWRASTNRATPIEELERVRVIGIDGLVLEVEPESGGAKDYRDRSGN
jgi:membrane-bound serine protease (ClpP class)